MIIRNIPPHCTQLPLAGYNARVPVRSRAIIRTLDVQGAPRRRGDLIVGREGHRVCHGMQRRGRPRSGRGCAVVRGISCCCRRAASTVGRPCLEYLMHAARRFPRSHPCVQTQGLSEGYCIAWGLCRSRVCSYRRGFRDMERHGAGMDVGSWQLRPACGFVIERHQVGRDSSSSS